MKHFLKKSIRAVFNIAANYCLNDNIEFLLWFKGLFGFSRVGIFRRNFDICGKIRYGYIFG